MASVEQAAALHQQLTTLASQFEAVKEKFVGYDILSHEQTPWRSNVEAMLTAQAGARFHHRKRGQRSVHESRRCDKRNQHHVERVGCPPTRCKKRRKVAVDSSQRPPVQATSLAKKKSGPSGRRI